MSDHWLIPPRPRSRAVPRRGAPPHLATLFEGFTAYLAVERHCRPGTVATYRWCFADFLRFVEGSPRRPLAISRFTSDAVRAYQYHLAERGLGATTIRLRLAVLASFARWAVRRGKLLANPVEALARPPKRTTLPATLRWGAVPELLDRCRTPRDRALVALLAYGGLRRSEVVTLDIADFDPGFGLRRVHGKGDHDAAVPLPASARTIVSDYLRSDRPDAAGSDPLFLVGYATVAGKVIVRRLSGRRVWTLVRDLGERAGIKGLHPHALRHACAVELLKRTKNLRAVQQHLRHRDVQSTTVYARLLPDELAAAVSAFDA
jgi:site-specific recombinase XerD